MRASIELRQAFSGRARGPGGGIHRGGIHPPPSLLG